MSKVTLWDVSTTHREGPVTTNEADSSSPWGLGGREYFTNHTLKQSSTAHNTVYGMKPGFWVRPSSQYDAVASIALLVSQGWCWNRTDFYSSVAGVHVHFQCPTNQVVKILDIKKKHFDQEHTDFFLLTTLATPTVPASYYEPGLTHTTLHIP